MAISGSTYRIPVILISLAIITGCSVEKNTRATRFYHRLTSRYNIYFNGNESYKAGVARVSAGYREDYSELLNVFEYSDPSTVSMCSSDMDRAIQKASKLISLKSITAKPELKGSSVPNEKEEEFMNRKEYNEWVDDSYLLMGKARIYKHEFDPAKSTLSYAISLSYDEGLKNEATIWLTRAYNETGNYNEAFRILTGLDLSNKFSDDLLAMYYTTLADLFLKQKRYTEAIDPLERSLRFVSGKMNKYRLTYLLAQLNEQAGNGQKATELYRNVIGMNPPYDVEFAARINMAGVFDLDSGDPESVMKELEKMLRDPVNRDFRDQIYYAIGNLLMKETKENEALDSYRKSAAASTTNRNQKAKSYQALAEFYFNRQDYLNSGRYYDSTIMTLDQNSPVYQSIRTKSQNLNALVKELTTIQVEDSLQKVANMTEPERNSLIASIIEKAKQEVTQASQQSDYTDRYNLGQFYENERRFQANIEQEGNWYFYNQTALTFGRTEFRRRWGTRQLEDNWRRQNRTRSTQAQPSANPEENIDAATDSIAATPENQKPEFYLKNLPLNDTLLRASNGRIADAILEAGKLYSEQFTDYDKAIESFETLLQRYPNSVLEPEALYNIYRVYQVEKDSRAEAYRQRLLSKYPDSEFSKILSDPEYYQRKIEELRKAENLYQEAYAEYLAENFERAVSLCDEGLSTYSKDDLAPKFMLLRSYCIARITDERTFKDELSRLMKEWPGTPESARAAELIAFLNQENPELKFEEEQQIAKEIYIDDKESPQIFVLIIQSSVFNINQATFDVISYNIDNYTNNNYRTQGSLVDDRYIMITVGGFPDLQGAMNYYNSFRTERIVRNTTGASMMTFVIGASNLRTLNTDKNPERYRIYFMENYLKEEERE